MPITRLAKILMTGALALFALLVAFNNLTDYGSNFAFVQHVLSMDSTFAGNAAMYRAVTTPALWHLAYALIIAGELLAGVLLLMGAIALWRAPGRAHSADASSPGARNATPARTSAGTRTRNRLRSARARCTGSGRIHDSAGSVWNACASVSTSAG